jgi:hypothetical protein
MNEEIPQDSSGRTTITLQDICLSNSWALQAILQFLEEEKPGSKDRIWNKYLELKRISEEAGHQMDADADRT